MLAFNRTSGNSSWPAVVYNGTNGIQGNINVGAAINSPVVVEDTGGPGTALAHWKESVYGNELMTGYINLGDNSLSRLMDWLGDLHYKVDDSRADLNYHVPIIPLINGRRTRRLYSQRKIKLHGLAPRISLIRVTIEKKN